MSVVGRRWRDRFGLQARMTASYVLVTAAAVLVVEVIAIGVIIPNYLAGQDLNNRVIYTASTLADRIAGASPSSTQLILPQGFVLGESTAVDPGQTLDEGQGIVVPQVAQTLTSSGSPLTVAVLFSTGGIVLASSYPSRYPVGSSIEGLLPAGGKSVAAGVKGAVSDVTGGRVAWAVQPVLVQLTKSQGGIVSGAKPLTPDAFVYVQAPAQPFTLAASFSDLQPLLQAGLAVLVLALPVGALFGLFTTRGMVRRLSRLAGTTALVAEGDFTQRVSPGAGDEVGRLEHNFNEMAQRLAAAMSKERELADISARQAERNRISRELHDSISQDLFSITLLAAGLEQTLPLKSQVRTEMRTLVETAEATNREMRALIMELRPATLEDRGLIPALDELAAACLVRFGIKVDTELEAVHLSPAAELAALRITQEGLANAVKHSHATTVKVALHRENGHVNLTISDDGQGFDPAANGSAERLGLRLMRERVEELAGTLSITSRPGEGTVVTASLPGASE
jgi:signal transduction histidine kinase